MLNRMKWLFRKKITGNVDDFNKEKYSDIKIIKHTLKYFFKEIWKHKKIYYVMYIPGILLSGIGPIINIILLKLLISNLLVNRNINTIVINTTELILINAAFYLLKNIIKETLGKLEDEIDRYFEIKISVKSMQMDYDYTENVEILNLVEKAKVGRGLSGGIQGITTSFSGIVSSLITFLGVIYLLAKASLFLLVIIVLTVIINSFLNSKSNKLALHYFKKLSSINRGFDYIFWQLTDFRYAKDLRLYKAEDMMLTKIEDYNDALTNNWKKQASETNSYQIGINIFEGLSDFITYIYLAYITFKKIITIADFTMLFNAFSIGMKSLNSIIQGLQDINKRSCYAFEYVKYMRYPNKFKQGNIHVNQNFKHEIEFRNVSFKYPDTDCYILKKISIKIRAGESLSIVGENGAGKTTFVKLLSRMYDVSEGEILLDNININDYVYDDYMKLLSIIFQDFQFLSFSIKENIVIDDSDINENEIHNLLSDVGLIDKINTLSNGIETTLYKQFDENGFVPSGGEAQKLALARALYKKSPIIILDEPTAALDPIAEYDLYKNFIKLFKGRSVVYISHRLSSCLLCDHIAVIKDGVIFEYGTHQELIKNKNGLYYRMFSEQAKYYK